MKTKILLTVFLFGIYQLAQSQVLITLLLGDKLNSPNLEFGLEGGVNWSQISGMDTDNLATKWNLGFYFDIRLKNQWWFTTGVLVKSELGVDHLTSQDLAFLEAEIYTETDTSDPVDGDYSQRLQTFLVPLLLKYKFENRIYVAGGGQVGLMRKSFIEFEAKDGDFEFKAREDNTDNLNRINAGVMVGTGYTLSKTGGMSIGVRYYEGLVNVYKETSGRRNRSFFLTATIPIGAGEKPDPQ